MKTVLAVFLLHFGLAHASFGQQSTSSQKVEQEIRRLEQQQVEHLLQGNVEGLEQQGAPEYVVTNPFNQAVKASQGPVRQAALTYSAFTRDVEKVLQHGHTVIVMGAETVVPSGTSADAGQMIRRRFKNGWMNTTGKWLLVARHASVVCQPASR